MKKKSVIRFTEKYRRPGSKKYTPEYKLFSLYAPTPFSIITNLIEVGRGIPIEYQTAMHYISVSGLSPYNADWKLIMDATDPEVAEMFGTFDHDRIWMGRAFPWIVNPVHMSDDCDLPRVSTYASEVKNAIFHKLMNNKDLIKQLIDTGDSEIQIRWGLDSYWGIGLFGNGTNKLGKIYMSLRETMIQWNKETKNETCSQS